MSDLKRTGGGLFDPKDPFAYFLASNVDRQQWAVTSHGWNLVAVNELNGEEQLKVVESWMDAGNRVFIDSGVFTLAMDHARAHGVHMDVALSLAPDEIDGFHDLFERYVKIVRRFEAKCWGYIELDQGGRENKIKTRAKLESMGLHPIPVYHPFNDGWEYFDELASQYDRICFGNVVQADRPTRKRLVATAWERKRRYPDLWIHLLGLTPNEWLNALPISSGDSSAWLSVVRWSGYKEKADGRSVGELGPEYQYQLGSDPTSAVGSQKAVRMSAVGADFQQRNWRDHVSRLVELGFEIYPPVGGESDAV